MAPFLKEICVDGNGYVLYMSIGSGGQPQTFEATQIVDAIEPFTWPPDSAAERTPTTVDQKTAASALDFPSEFQLSTSR